MFVKSLLFLCFFQHAVPRVDQDSTIQKVQPLGEKYCAQVASKSNGIADKLRRENMKAVNALLANEQAMQQKLAAVDKDAANRIFQSSIDSLKRMQYKLKAKLPLAGRYLTNNETVDSLKNVVAFLGQNENLLGNVKNKEEQLKGAGVAIEKLNDKFQEADVIRNYLQEQKAGLNQALAPYTSLSKDLAGLNKQAYYYSQQLNEYKSLLNDRKKAEAKALALLQQLPAYQNFMKAHSPLAALFNIQNGADPGQSLEGLQTRSIVEQTIQQRLGGASAGDLTKQMDAARGQLESLKNQYSGLNNAGELPNFKPNSLKTKSLRQRLEFGGNTQFEKSTQFFPTTADLAGQVAYKFVKNGSAGIGVSYKLGMGTYQHIHFTSQGIGLRSFLEWKIKDSFFATGGIEENYNIPYVGSSLAYSPNEWSTSALAGISKKVQLNKGLKANVMLLYDFLAFNHSPSTQPLVLRMGYNF